MNVLSKNKVQVFTNSELKSVLEDDNDYDYIYLWRDITLFNGIIINSKKLEVTIDGTNKNVRYTYTNKKSLAGADTITELSTTNYYWVVTDYTLTIEEAKAQKKYSASHTNYKNYNYPYLYWGAVNCTNGYSESWTCSSGQRYFN